MPEIHQIRCEVAAKICAFAQQHNIDIFEDELLEIGSVLQREEEWLDDEEEPDSDLAARKEALGWLQAEIKGVIERASRENLSGKTPAEIEVAYGDLLFNCVLGQSPEQIDYRGND